MATTADAADWPFMPLDVAPIDHAPRPGEWVWYLPDRPRHTSFHEVRSIEILDDEDEGAIELVVVTCGRAWPIAELAAIVDVRHPVLRRSADGTNAQCPNCANEHRGGSNHWARRLREGGNVGEVGDHSDNCDRGVTADLPRPVANVGWVRQWA